MGSGGNPASQWLVQKDKANRGSDALVLLKLELEVIAWNAVNGSLVLISLRNTNVLRNKRNPLAT